MAILKKRKITGEELGEVSLSDKIILEKDASFAIQQTVRQYLASKHRGTHKTKTRSEVTGSRRKLFRQKGTGNARAGDAKSPIRRHGGVAFGPVVRDHSFKINKKIRKKSLCFALSNLIKTKQLFVVDKLELAEGKTKKVREIMKNLGFQKAIFVDQNLQKNFELACRNLPNVLCIRDSSLNVYELLRFHNLVITEKSLKNIESKLLV
jgi:large subunit ribosomal protein L4